MGRTLKDCLRRQAMSSANPKAPLRDDREESQPSHQEQPNGRLRGCNKPGALRTGCNGDSGQVQGRITYDFAKQNCLGRAAFQDIEALAQGWEVDKVCVTRRSGAVVRGSDEAKVRGKRRNGDRASAGQGSGHGEGCTEDQAVERARAVGIIESAQFEHLAWRHVRESRPGETQLAKIVNAWRRSEIAAPGDIVCAGA